ncbi:MAG: YbaN family protein [Actinomycetota bacterium]
MHGAGRDEGAEAGGVARPHPRRWVRVLAWCGGTAALLVGAVGVVVPVLPTTPFVLLAAGCYARASTRVHRRLVGHPRFGPLIGEWRRHRSIPHRTKLFALAVMPSSIALSIWLMRGHPWVQGMLAATALAVGGWLWRVPSRDRPARDG